MNKELEFKIFDADDFLEENDAIKNSLTLNYKSENKDYVKVTIEQLYEKKGSVSLTIKVSLTELKNAMKELGLSI
jgi:hypothetical protein